LRAPGRFGVHAVCKMRGETGCAVRRCCGAASEPRCHDGSADPAAAVSACPPLLEGFNDGAFVVLHYAGFRSAAALRRVCRSWHGAIAFHFGDQLRWVSDIAFRNLDLATIDDRQGNTEVRCSLRGDELRVAVCPTDVCDFTQPALGVVDTRTGVVGSAWALGPYSGDENEPSACPAYCTSCVVDFRSETEVHVMPLASPAAHHVVDISASEYYFFECELRMQHCACSNDDILMLHVLPHAPVAPEAPQQQTFLVIHLASGRQRFVTAPRCPKIICRLTLTENFLVAWQGEITDSGNNVVNKSAMYLGDWAAPNESGELSLNGDEWPPVEDESRGGTKWLAAWKLPADLWEQTESLLVCTGTWRGMDSKVSRVLDPAKDTIVVASRNFELLCIDLHTGERRLTALDAIAGSSLGITATGRGAVAALLVASSDDDFNSFSGFAAWDPTSGTLLRHVAVDELSAGLHMRCATHSPAPPCWADGPMQGVGARHADVPAACCIELGTGCTGRIAAHPSRPMLALSLRSEEGCGWTLLLRFGRKPSPADAAGARQLQREPHVVGAQCLP